MFLWLGLVLGIAAGFPAGYLVANARWCNRRRHELTAIRDKIKGMVP